MQSTASKVERIIHVHCTLKCCCPSTPAQWIPARTDLFARSRGKFRAPWLDLVLSIDEAKRCLLSAAIRKVLKGGGY